MKVKINELSASIELELSRYADEVQEKLADSISAVASDLVKTLKKTSPKKTGDYRKGWRKKKSGDIKRPGALVYNATHGWLAHLLEFGHAKVNGGRVDAIPHIADAAKLADAQLQAEVERFLEGMK